MLRARFVFTFFAIVVTSSLAAAADFVSWPDAVKSAFAGGYVDGRYAEAPPVSKLLTIADDGTVAMINASERKLTLYPHLSSAGVFSDAIAIPLESTPLQVVFKRLTKGGVFVVSLSGGARPLSVFDAHTGAALKSCSMMVSDPISLAPAGNADSPYVYYAGDLTGIGRPSAGRVDLNRFTDDGPIELPDYDRYELVVSDDGTLLYARRPGTSPMGFMSFRITSEPLNSTHVLRATKIVYEHETRPAYVVDPSTGNVVSGNVMYAPDLSSTVATLPAYVVAFSRSRPLMFGFGADGSLQVLSANTHAVLSQLPLTPGATATPLSASNAGVVPTYKPPTSRPSRRLNRTRRPTIGGTNTPAPFACLVDDAHQTLLLASPEHVIVVHLADLSLPNEPSLGVTIAGGTTLMQGQAWAATVKPKDAKTTVTLAGSPPVGLTCTHNTLRWTPAVSDIGSHSLLLHLVSGTTARDMPITLDVRRACLALDMDVQSMNVSPDGSTALLIGTEATATRRMRSRPDDTNLQRLTLVDLRHQTVLARRTMEVPISAAAVDSHFAYVGLQGSAAMMTLSLRDLSDAKRIFTAGPVYQLRPTGPRLYVAMQGKPTTWFATPELKPDPTPPSPGPFDNQSTPLPTAFHGGWFINNVVYAADFKAVKALVQDDELPRLTSAAVPFNGSMYGQPPVDDWGVQIMGDQLRRVGRQEVVNFGQRGAVASGEARVGALLHDVPALVVLTRSRSRSDTAALATERADLSVFDVVTGVQRATLPLFDEPTNPGDGVTPPLLDSAPGRIIAEVNGRLFVIPTSQLPVDKLTRPLEVSPPDGALMVAPAGLTTLEYTVTGGQAPVSLALDAQAEGISLDSASHQLTIESAPLLPRAVDLIAQTIQNRFSYAAAGGSSTTQSTPGALYRDWAAKRYRQVTGRSPMGYAVAVPISVVATDADQQQYKLQHTLLLDVPAAVVDSRLATQAAQRRPAFIPPAVQPQSSLSQMQQRIDQLTAQNERLQAKVDVLTELLTREHGGASTRP